MDLIFFGMQGAGKGTMGKLAAAKYGMQIFETGGELRKLAQEDSPLGQKIKSIIEAGHLVSNEVVMEIVENFMQSIGPNDQVLFDGIPRKVQQAESLNAVLEKHGREYKGVLLEITQDIALKRLTTRRICKECKTVFPGSYDKESCEKCGGELYTRADDNPEAIKTRLEAFQNETVPAIELYQDKLIKVDGTPGIEKVEQSLYQALDPIMEK